MKYAFHNLEFSHNQQIQIVEYYEIRTPVVHDVLVTVLEQDIKVSFSYDNYHDCNLMSITPKDKEHPFYGYVVSVRHTDLETLVKTLFWLVAEGFDQMEAPGDAKSKYDW